MSGVGAKLTDMCPDPTSPSTSRREFLHAAASASLPVWLGACTVERRPDPDAASGPTGGSDTPGGRNARATEGDLDEGEPLTRPLLRPWADGIVSIEAPPDELPVAYVSMAERSVFVDRDYRDRVSWLLGAHISVSTWHWRIPLPGDPPGQPISPGDTLREFEEFEMRDWDPSTTPAMDDIRVVRGVRWRRLVDFACVPLANAASERWCRGGPFDLVVSGGDRADTTREDFMVVGTGLGYPDRACERVGQAVQYVTWAVRGTSL